MAAAGCCVAVACAFCMLIVAACVFVAVGSRPSFVVANRMAVGSFAAGYASIPARIAPSGFSSDAHGRAMRLSNSSGGSRGRPRRRAAADRVCMVMCGGVTLRRG